MNKNNVIEIQELLKSAELSKTKYINEYAPQIEQYFHKKDYKKALTICFNALALQIEANIDLRTAIEMFIMQ